MKTLTEKINKLDPWFKTLNEDGRNIHDVFDTGCEVFVVWSDSRGYSFSWKSINGQGTSGVYKDLIRCLAAVSCLHNDFMSIAKAKLNRKNVLIN